MADSPYFDPDYFDQTYFDDPQTGGGRHPVARSQPDPLLVDDEEFLWLTS